LRRAIELNPNDAHAYHHLGNYLRAMGRADEAAAAREAVELDPLNARTIIVLAGDYTVTGDFDGALLQYRRALQIDPAHLLTLGAGPFLPSCSAMVYERQGRIGEAIVEYIRIATLRGASHEELDQLKRALASEGMSGFLAQAGSKWICARAKACPTLSVWPSCPS
jgi:tetratricopeptide (TPR) repeat protein